MKKIADALYFAWAIALKDVQDAFRNRATRTNILVLVGLVVFFYWMSNLRPFDTRVNVVVLDQGSSSLQLDRTTLQDGSELDFRMADSMADLEQKMAYQDLGLILPGDFEEQLVSGNQLTLSGYVHWAKRGQAAELENKYSAMLSELLGSPVLILVIAIAGFSVALNGIYIIHWGWALLGFLMTALFAIGLSLLLGTWIRSPKQITLWMLPVAFLFVVPGFFADEPNLAAGAKAVMDWLPGVALNRIMGFSVSDGAVGSVLGANLAIAIAAILVVYALVIWQIRRSDR